MKSGLEGRNNVLVALETSVPASRLNEVRPRRPEQSLFSEGILVEPYWGLNEVRPRRPEQ